MRQFFIQHRTVDLPFDGEYEPTLRHGKPFREVIENSLLGHRSEVLRVNLYGLQAQRGAKRSARVLRRCPNVRYERGNIDKPDNFWIVTGLGNHGAAPGMTHQNDRAILMREDPSRGAGVVCQ